jgi:rRNA maturation RNase YbeY
VSVIAANRQKKIKVNVSALRRSVEKMTYSLGLTGREVGLILTDNAEIKALNRMFLHRRGATNVLAFPMCTGTSGPLLGDIIISVEKAKEEARRAGLTLMERLLRLTAHGLLHIIGYTHEGSSRDAKKMEEMESLLIFRAKRFS